MGTVDPSEPSPEGEVMTMQEMWDDVEKLFEDLTGKALRSKGKTTLDDCKAQIAKLQQLADADADPAPTKRSGGAKAKSFAMDMLHCVKLLGGVATQGASIVFPPASFCFSAISLLLDIPADLHKFHEAVIGLFDTLGQALGLFNIYGKIERFTELEPDLIRGTHRLMISFVTICALSIKLRETRKWDKFKVEAKLILLQKDSDVGKEVDNFRDLLAAHSVQQGAQQLLTLIYTKDEVTQVLYQASESGKRIDEILSTLAAIKDSTDKAKSEETVRKNLKDIKEKLGLRDGIDKTSQDVRDKFWHDRLDGTVRWIDNPSEHPEFHSWAERKDTNAKALFTLTGNSNTGKSVIVSSIVYHLRSKYESASRKLEQTIVASYFFPSGKSDSDKQPVQTAMKAIALQIASVSETYSATLAKECRENPKTEEIMKNAKCTHLWDALHLGTPSNKTAYYLVFDGLANLSDEYHEDQMELLALLSKLGTASRAVRALVSLRPDMTVPGLDEATRWNLDVEEDGKQDVCFYINESLKKDDILQDDDEYRTEMRNKILTRLSEDLGGNYYKVMTALEKIKTIVRTTGKGADIDKVLDEANEDEKAISLRAIRKLEESLSVEEIEELNELLIWIGYSRGYRPIPLDYLNAALFLKFKIPSMLNLEKKLSGKYGSLFQVSGGGASIDSDMLALVDKGRTVPRGEDENKFSVNITITKANLTSVQRFLWNLTMKLSDLDDNFGFQKLEDKTAVKGTIQVNGFDSYLTILKRTFQLLIEAPNKATKSIAPYLLNYLPQHLDDLKEAPTLHPLTPIEKQAIGEGLYALFATGDVVKTHWESCNELIWYRDVDELDTFLTWFKDPDITSKLGVMDRKWLKEVASSSNPRRALLQNIMETVAMGMLRDTEWKVDLPFGWILSFLNLEPPTRDDASNLDDPREAKIAELRNEHGDAAVDFVTAWCQHILRVKEPDDLWNERVAEVYFVTGNHGEAIKRFRAASERETPTLRSLEGLANSLAGEDRWEEACQTMEKALGLLDSDNAEDKTRLVDDYMQLSGWYNKRKNLPKTVEYLHKALSLSPDDHEARYRLLCAWLDSEEASKEATKLLHELAESAFGRDKPSQFGHIINKMVDADDGHVRFGQLFAAVSVEAGLSRRTMQELDRAMERAKERDASLEHATLLFYKGLATYHYSIADTVPNKASFEYWNDCIESDRGWGTSTTDVIYLASSFIASHHFEQATLSLDPAAQSKHVDALKAMADKDRSAELSPAMSYLACYYAQAKEPDKARDVVRACINSAFEYLSDADDENDNAGYFYLLLTLMQCGDLLNAHSALSLMLPPPVKTNVLAWILDFDAEPEKRIAADLIARVDSDADIKEQIKFVLKALGVEDAAEPDTDEANEPGETKETGEAGEAIDAGDVSTAEETKKAEELAETSERRQPTVDSSAEGGAPTSQETKYPPEASERIVARVRSFSRLQGMVFSGNRCDGSCNTPWTLDTQQAMYWCRCCINIAFCDKCMVKLHHDKLRLPVASLVCSPSHPRMPMPVWAQQNYLEALRGNVCVGGEIADDGTRVGGKFVPIAAWLDGLKAEWGYVDKPKTPEGKDEAEAEGGAEDEDAGKEAAPAPEASADETMAAVTAMAAVLQVSGVEVPPTEKATGTLVYSLEVGLQP